MNKEKKSFYDDNGYVILEKVFSDEEAEIFNNYMRRHADKKFSALINPDRYDSLLDQDERPKSVITLKEIKDTSSMARAIMTDKKMINLLNFFHEKKSIGLSSQFIFKEAYSDYCLQAWKPHQDNFYPKSKNAAYVTLNWFLKDADKENGTIYCYPGSHKLGLLPAENNISFREKVGSNPGSECQIPKEFLKKKTDIIIPGNSIVILNGNCIHGSYPNKSNRSRPWYSSCYISEGEDFTVGNSSKRKEIKLS